MANHKYTTEGLIQKFKELKLPKEDYACIGSVGLYLNGMIKEIHDIDVIARGAAWKKALTLGSLGYDDYYHLKNRISILDGQIEVFAKWPYENVDKLIDEADVIDGIKVVELKHVFKYMKNLGRPKDRNHLNQIIRFLKSLFAKKHR